MEARAPAALVANLPLLDTAEAALAQTLIEAGQEHLFANWHAPGEKDQSKHDFFDKVCVRVEREKFFRRLSRTSLACLSLSLLPLALPLSHTPARLSLLSHRPPPSTPHTPAA